MPFNVTHTPTNEERERQGNIATNKILYQFIRAVDAELAQLRTVANVNMTPRYSNLRTRLIALVQRIGGQ